MNATLKHHILEEVENLIDYSCVAPLSEDSNIEGLQHAILKKYFAAESVSFNREANVIVLEIREDEKSTKFVEVHVDFNKFAPFLKTCLENDRGSLRFYKNLLRYYHVIEPISA